MNKYKKPAYYITLYASLPLFLLSTNPEKLPLPLIIVPFVMLFAVLFFSAVKIIKTLVNYEYTEIHKQYMVAAFLAGFPVLILIFQSLHQLSWRDALIIGGLLIGSVWYLKKLDLYKSVSVS